MRRKPNSEVVRALMAGLDGQLMRGMDDRQMVLPPPPMPKMDYEMFMTPEFEQFQNPNMAQPPPSQPCVA